ncbi:MAG: M56 family metallopeptidase, partial [Terracidiphilus sp.]
MQLAAIVDAVQWALPGASDFLASAWRAWSQVAAPIVVAALWQGAAVAAGPAICLQLAPRISAAHRFAAWAAGFAALVCLPFLPLFSQFSAGATSGIPAHVAEAGARPWLQLDVRWGLAIAALWAAAFVFRAVDLAIHSLRLRKLWKSAIPVEPGGSLHSSLAHLTLRGRGPVQLCTTQELDCPSVIGFLAPRILIPEWLLARLTPGELEQIVLHEAEHLRRGDDWTNLFQKLCLAVFPLNPALWWIERRLCREREMACDDGVVRVTHAPRAYAACLASLAERGLQRRAEALSLGAWQRRPEVVHRVHSILKRNYALSPLATRTLLGALGCGLLFGSVELAQCPQWIAFVPTQTAEAAQALAPSRTIAESAPVLRAPVLRASDTPVRRAKRFTAHASVPRKAASP